MEHTTMTADVLDLANLAAMVEAGMIARKESGDGRILYDYTAHAQFTGTWNTETRACRGLVAGADGRLLARPFPKFHNLAEHDGPALAEIPDEPFEVVDKLDGSLIIAYHWAGATRLHTRGSFRSDQAVAAQAWWAGHATPDVPVGETWLFEWIAPENRIVVDYAGQRELVLLAALDNATGRDLPLPETWTGARARRFDFASLAAVAAAERDDAEGYVVRFAGGLRVKIKGSEYVRLHRLLTGVTARTIWASLAAGDDLDRIVDGVPDEFHRWVQATADDLLARFDAAKRDAAHHLDEARRRAAIAAGSTPGPDDRKRFAAVVAGRPDAGVLFALLDGKDIGPRIWRSLRPDADRPFTTDSGAA